MKKAKLGLIGMLALPFMLGNSPAPGPNGVSVSIDVSNEDGVVTVTNKSKDRYITSLTYDSGNKVYTDSKFTEGYYLGDVNCFLAPGKSYVTDFGVPEGLEINKDDIEATGYTQDQIVFLDEEIATSVNKSGDEWTLGIKGRFANPSTEEVIYKVGAYYEEDGIITAYMVDGSIDPYETRDIDDYLTLEADPGTHQYKKMFVYDNEYYSSRWPGRDDSPLAIVAYVFLGLLGAAVIGTGVFLLVKNKEAK